jgi:acyl-coenzyme A thioesterase PaaI-like protein
MCAATVEQLNDVLAATPFLQAYGFAAQSCASGECTLLVPFCPTLERPGGIVSGMTIMGAADVAMWLAVMTLRGTSELWVTADLKTAFLRTARHENILCIARILKPGKRTMYGVADSLAPTGGLVAHHVMTYTRVE